MLDKKNASIRKSPAKNSTRRDSTCCVHAGEERHGQGAPLTTSIAQTSVFALKSFDQLRQIAEGKSHGYLYTRYANPTTAVAEEKIAALEGGGSCVVTSSGMAAILSAILAVCKAGDEIVSMLDVYGGTLRLFLLLERFGIKVRLVPFDELSRVDRYLTRRTRMLFLETPTNPTLRCVDIEVLAAKARRVGACVVVDNTFATPILQKPLSLGAHISLHSATKYLGGHSDLTAGALVGSPESSALIDTMREMMVTTGGSLDPGASYLLIRGLKTLELRVERACRNAARTAEALDGHPKIARVMYPGFPRNEGHAAATKQMKGFGMIVSINLKGGGRAAEKFIDSLKLWYLATSLGGVESTVSYPVFSSHLRVTEKQRTLMDVSAATVRLSFGVENWEDLMEDLSYALAKT